MMKTYYYLLLVAIIQILGCKNSTEHQTTIQCLAYSNGDIKHFMEESDYKMNKHDQALYSEITKSFGFIDLYRAESPIAFYFDDSSSNQRNAFAFTQNVPYIFEQYGISNKGYIAIGKNFASQLAPIRNGKQIRHYAFPFVLAHELAHIVQYDIESYYMPNNGKFPNNIPVEHIWSLDDKAKELNADYAAGLFCSAFYLYKLKNKIDHDKYSKETYINIVNSIDKFICSVNSQNYSYSTHGSCKERITAFKKGLNQELNSTNRFIIPYIYRDLKERISN